MKAAILVASVVLAAELPALPQDADTTPAAAARAPQQRLGVELAALGTDCELTFAELDELLLWRHGLSPDGRGALRQLLELRLLEHLANQQGIVITRAQLNARWAALEREIVSSGQAETMHAFLAANDVRPDTFREYLRLALVHEQLTCAALGLADDASPTGEQQTMWLQGEIERRGYVELPHPWQDGVVATSGDDLSLTTADFAQHLRTQLPSDMVSDACYELLLEKRVRARLPDLSEEAVEEAVEAEVQRRRADVESDPRYKGIAYEQLLEARGLSLEAVRRDPAIRAAALAHRFVDRSHDDAALREVYAAERELFDARHGVGVEVYAILLRGARFKNPANPRTFEEAEEELLALRARVEGLEDFQRLARLHSEDPATREAGGRIGVVTAGSPNVPAPIREAASAALEETAGELTGALLGPLRIQGGVVLLILGGRRPAPSWETMAQHVHRELRRRFVEEALPRQATATWLD
jgi:hypothetical protein